MQPIIFFSSRRADAPTDTHSLRQQLAKRYGWQQLFSDYDTLPASEAWAACRKRAIRRCDAYVLLVGPQWDALAGDPDALREQIDWAREAGRWIIPVTYCGATLPADLELEAAIDLGNNPIDAADSLLDLLDTRLSDLHDQTAPPPQTNTQIIALRLGVAPEDCDLDALLATLTRYMALGERKIEIARVREGLVVSLRLPSDAAANLERLLTEYPDLFADFGGASLDDDEPLDDDPTMTTSMPMVVLSEWEHLLAVARRYMRKRQFQLARRELELARREAESADEVFDDGGFARELQTAAADAAQQAHEALTVLLANSDERRINLRQAQDWLDVWYDALPDDQDPDYLRVRARVRDLTQRRQSDALYRNTRDRVEALWDDVRLAGNEGARTEELLEILRRARDVARDGAANHPQDARFQQLLDEAEQRRQRTAEEQDKMLSGAQSQQFELTLQHILATPEDETVPVYNENAVLQGRYPPRAALSIVVPQARNYANRKVNEYLTQANSELQAGLPRTAKSTLADISKFDVLGELVSRAGDEALLYPDTVLTLVELQTDIAQSERLLDEMEARVEAAVLMADRDALGAWDTYAEAHARFPEGATNSSLYKEARLQLQRALENSLDQLLADLNGRLAVADPASYYSDNALEPLIDEARASIERYGAIDLPLRDRVRQLESVAHEANSRQQAVLTIERELQAMADQVEDKPQAAADALQALERNADTRLLEAHPRYDSLRHTVNLRLSESNELSRLNALLDSPNPARVEAAQQAAANAAHSSERYTAQFENLATRLAAHHALLLADAIARRDGYDLALAQVEAHETPQLEALDPALHGRVSAKLEQLRENADSIGVDAQRVRLARQLYDQGDLLAAHGTLRDVTHFHDAQERREYASFRAEVENALAHAIMARVDGLTLSETLDPALREQIDLLELISPQAAQRYRQRFVVLDAVQRARDLASANDYRAAIEQLQSALPDVSGDERQHLAHLLADYQRRVLRVDTQQAVQAVRDARPDSDESRDAMTSLLATIQRLEQSVAQSSDPFAQLQFLAWQLELVLIRAEVTGAADTRRALFDQAESLGDALYDTARLLDEALLNEEQRTIVHDALALADAGRYSPHLTHAIRAVESYLHADADFGLFSDAVAQFERALTDYEPYFVTLINWYEDRIALTQADLRRSIEALGSLSAAQGIAPVQLPFYAKLLVLDPEDSQGQTMLRDLPRLGQRLSDDVERLHQSIFEQAGYSMAGDTDILDTQLTQVSAALEQIALLRDLLERFSGVPILEEQLNALLSNSNRLNERLLTMDTHLRRFKDEVQRFSAQVSAVDLVDDADEQWHDADDQIETVWLAFEDNVRAINPDLLKHPALRRAASTRDEQRKRLQLLVQRLREIERSVAAEDYVRAVALMNNLDEAMQAFFRRTSLYTTYTVPDRWYNSQVSGWRSVTALVERRAIWQTRIERWAASFDVPLSVLENDDETTPAAVPASSNIVDWAVEQTRIEAQLAQRGDFEAALAATRCAMEGCSDMAALSLREAQRQALNPPLAMAEDEQTGSYQEAQQQAGSQRARRALSWVRTHRLPQLAQALNVADAYVASLKSRAEQWQRAEAALVEAIKRLSTRMEQRGFFGRLKDREGLAAALEDYEAVLLRMEGLAGHHPHLPQYQQDPDYRAALRIVGRTGV